MSSLEDHINIQAVEKKFTKSKLLSILIRVIQATNNFQKNGSLRLTAAEKEALLDSCYENEFEPAWVLMTCFGALIPMAGNDLRATVRFRNLSGYKITTIIGSTLAIVNIISL